MAATVPKDMVKETITSSGTGTPVNLGGAVAGFRGFVAAGLGGQDVDYNILDGTAWEVGYGTVTDAATDTLSRNLVASSTGSLLSLSGSATVHLVFPADKIIHPDGRTGGQTIIGGDGSGDDLTLTSTSHATKGDIVLGLTDTVKIGTPTPTTYTAQTLEVKCKSMSNGGILIEGSEITQIAPYLVAEDKDGVEKLHLTAAGALYIGGNFFGTTGTGGGLQIHGGSEANDVLILRSTTDATKGLISIWDTTNREILSATDVGLTIEGFTAQSGNYFEINTIGTSGGTLWKIDSTGTLNLGNGDTTLTTAGVLTWASNCFLDDNQWHAYTTSGTIEIKTQAARIFLGDGNSDSKVVEFGYGVTTTTKWAAITDFGGGDGPTIWIGDGQKDPTLNVYEKAVPSVAGILSGIQAITADTQGGSLIINGGRGVGDGASGDVIFKGHTPNQGTGSTVRTYETVATCEDGAWMFYREAVFDAETQNNGDVSTINWTTGNNQELDLATATGAVTLAFTAPSGVAHMTLRVTQGSTAYDITWPGTLSWLGTEPTWSGDANETRIVGIYYDGAAYWAAASAYVGEASGGAADRDGITRSAQTVTTTDITGAANTFYDCTIAGLTADRNVTLPSGASVDDRIMVRIVDGDPDYELIIKGATGVSINGGTAATEWSRLFIANEVVTFRNVGTNDWIVEHDGRIPCVCVMHRNGTNQTVVDATWDQLEYTNTAVNVGSCGDTTNFEFGARRTGNYQVAAWVASVSSMADQQPITHKITSDAAGAQLLYSQIYTSVATSNNLSNTLGGLLVVTAGGKLEHWCYIDFVSTATVDGRAEITGLSVHEVL